MNMRRNAQIVVETTHVPHDREIHRNYSIRFRPEADGFAYLCASDWRMVPATYRGRIDVSCECVERQLRIGDRFAFANFRFRVVEVYYCHDVYECVFDSPFAFLSVLDTRWRHAGNQIAWRLIATARIWGVLKPYDETRVTVPYFRWRDIYVVDRLCELFEARQ